MSVRNTTKLGVLTKLGWIDGPLTATRIVLLQEFIQGNPAATHAHHNSAAKDTNEAQFLGVSKLK